MRSRLRFPSRRRAGMTLVEMSFALAISTMVWLSVVGVQYISGRTIQTLYSDTRTRSSRMIALDQIRYRLASARIGSVTVTQPRPNGEPGFHRIEFVDPNFGGVTSAFWYVTASNSLMYDENIAGGDAPRSVVTGPIDISFEPQSAGAIVVLRVTSLAEQGRGDVDMQDGETRIYLRNT